MAYQLFMGYLILKFDLHKQTALSLVWFYGMSIIVGYLMANPFYR